MRSIILLISIVFVLSLSGQAILTVGGNIATAGGKVIKTSAPLAYIALDGVNEKITFASSITLTKPFSISMWLNTSSYSDRTIIANTSGSNNNVSFASSTVINYRFGATLTAVTHGLTFTTNSWQLFTAVVAADGTITTYRNAIASATTGSNTNNLVVNQAYTSSSASTKYVGNADELCLWSKALSQAEINTLYGLGTPQSAGDPKSIGSLALYYRYEGSTVPTIVDESGNSKTGTCQNMETGDIIQY